MEEKLYSQEDDLDSHGQGENKDHEQDGPPGEPSIDDGAMEVPLPPGEEVVEEESRDLTEDEKDEVIVLRDALEKEEAQKEEYLRLLQRTMADFENYRRRMERGRRETIKRANEELFLQLLPILDNLELALQTGEGSSADSIVEGVGMIYRQFLDVLAKEGVKPVPALGEVFDPRVHEAVMQVDDTGAAAGTIVEELKKGYLIHDRVLRPSMVKVARM